MHPALQQLLSLQQLDLLAAHDAQFIARYPAEVAALDKMTQNKQSDIRTAEDKVRQAEVRLRTLDLNAKSETDRIAQLRARQASTRKNEEYQAIEHEVATHEQKRNQIEEEELQLMEEIELLKGAVLTARAAFIPVQEQLNKRRGELDIQLAAAQKRLSDTQQKITTIRPQIDANLLKQYDRLCAGGKLNALVPLSHGKICSGCHLEVTSQTILDARSTDRIGICENCGRILYDPDYEASQKK